MQHLLSDQIEDFAAIYDEDIEIVSVSRPMTNQCAAVASELVQSRQVPSARWVQEVGNSDALVTALPVAVHALFVDLILEASEVLGELFGCERVGVRLETLSAPMCPRFHVDQIPCRLLATLAGKGTEWIAASEVDWDAFNHFRNSDAPLLADGCIRHFPTGHWSLLKGGKWDEQFKGVVHRSPHGVGGRLLLSLDPIV